MHKVLATLSVVQQECARTDELAKTMGLLCKSEEHDALRWGYSDFFQPKDDAAKPMRIGLSRGVFLLPDTNIASAYDLGFNEDWETGMGQLFVAYRLNLSHTFGPDDAPTTYDFPVTVFYEAVKNRWRGTALLAPDGRKKSPYNRPQIWTDILAAHDLDHHGQLAQGMSHERAFKDIESMMRICATHTRSRRQLRGKVLRA